MLLFAGCVALLGVSLFLLQLGKNMGKHSD
jgi:hypothetical protein